MQEKELSHCRECRRPRLSPMPFALSPVCKARCAQASHPRVLTGVRAARGAGLAMIAAAGFLAQEAVTGQTWGAAWGDASF